MKKPDEFVNVSVRIKPTSDRETCIQIINKQPAILYVSDRAQTFHFDNIFTEDVDQAEVYNDTVRNLVENVKAGFNCTVFAYGQTGTGKTYTIGTNPEVTRENESGLILRTLNDFFASKNSNGNIETDIAISFIEIYNEKVFDLLAAPTGAALPVKGFAVHGFEKVPICSTVDAIAHLQNGSRRRHIGETKLNISSSRSHAVFTIYCHTRSSDNETLAKLNLVDLAGSERLRKTGNQGSMFVEGVNINKALLSLGQVMTALSNNSGHIPYRQSILTTILQDSLNKKNFVSLIACVSPKTEDLGETLQTLEFANRVKRMKNRPEVNQLVMKYRREHPSWMKGLTPNTRSYETPLTRKKSALPAIREPMVRSTSFEISPLLSSSMISMASNTPNTFSPIIKKYMNALESTILSKVENAIERTLRKRKTTLLEDDKENYVPKRTSWKDVKCFAQTDFASPKRYIFDSNLDSTLEYNTNKALTDDSIMERDDESIFKKPALPNKFAESPPRRRSVRLQAKQSVGGSKLKQVVSNRRRSVRIQAKMMTKDEHQNTTQRYSVQGITSPCLKCRIKNVDNRKKSKDSLKDSPITSREKHVLNILNNGSIRDLQKLHTIGAKTAEKIKLYRELRGQFKNIEDVADMPYWTKNKYDKFLAENFLQ